MVIVRNCMCDCLCCVTLQSYAQYDNINARILLKVVILVIKLAKNVSSMSLKRKLQIMFITMMSACILFCFALFYVILESRMETNSIEKDKSNRVAITRNIDNIIGQINTVSRMLLLRDEVLKFLKSEKPDAAQYRRTIRDIHHLLNAAEVSCNVTLFRTDRKNVSTGPGITYIDTDIIFDTGWLDDIRDKKGAYVIKSDNSGAFASNIGRVITFSRVINDINTQREIGILAINIPCHFLESSYEGLDDDSSNFAIYSGDGYRISTNNVDMFERNIKPGETKSKIEKSIFRQDVLNIAPIDSGDFVLASRSKVEIVQGMTEELLLVVGAVILIMIVFLVLINAYVSRKVITPIHKLVGSMQEIEDGWLHRVSMDISNDEIGQLKNSYNAMLIEINHLIDELIKKEKNLRDVELETLLSQMKPHFLYNTLDMIRCLALEGETDQVYDLLETLGSFYRNFLSKGSVDIPLREEVQIVRDYLKLQKNRFGEILEDEYIIDETLDNIRVPRLMLQPLVENSIYHGIRPKGEPGVITIKTCRDAENLLVSVKDTGIGISEERRDLLVKGDLSGSFGFRGTIDRIKYYYKKEDVFEVNSVEGEYFEVLLKLPISAEFETTSKKIEE